MVVPETLSVVNPIWITGAAGLIGHQLVRLASDFDSVDEVVGLTRAELDLTNFRAVRSAFSHQSPRMIIHCAALSQSPACQADPALAHKLNVEVTDVLAGLAAAIPFVFFSTDLVFDGCAGNYDESAPVNPLSIYAETKVGAEQIVLKNRRHTVVRTSLNGGTSPRGNRGFNEQLRKEWQAGRVVRLFADEFRSPIAASVTARAVWEIALNAIPGIYHVAGSQRLSRLEMGQLIAARWPGLNPKIERASRLEHQGAPRPPDTSLNCGKAQRHLSFPLPGLADWLQANPGEPF